MRKKDDLGDVTEEYSVYIFHPAETEHEFSVDWEKKVTTKHKRRAIVKAKKLYATHDYERVEVKKKLCDARDGSAVAITTKVFCKQKWMPDKLPVSKIRLGFIVCAGLISAVLFILFKT